MMYFSRKLALACVLTAAMASFSYSNALAYSEGDFHTPTAKEELNAAEKTMKLMQKRYPDMEESLFLTEQLQAPLIKYNPTLLKKATKKNEDGLRKVYVMGKNNPGEIGKGAFNITAGNIALTQGLINARMAFHPGSYEPKPYKDYDVYALSSLAPDYAREVAHWYYNDGWTNKNQAPLTSEEMPWINNRATAFGQKLLGNVPTISIGGQIMADLRIQEEDYQAQDEKLNETYDYIMKLSNYRVGFTNDVITTNQLLVADKNGDYWEAFTPAQFDVTALKDEAQTEEKSIMTRGEDRAYYVAGQVAWAINHKAWDSQHVELADAHKYFKDLPKDIKFTAIIATADDGSWKLIDWYLDDSSYLTGNQLDELNLYIDGIKASYDDAINY